MTRFYHGRRLDDIKRFVKDSKMVCSSKEVSK